METATYLQDSRGGASGETERVANGEEAVVAIPVIVPPIEVELPLGVVPIEVRHVAMTPDLGDGTLYKLPSISPPLVHPSEDSRLYSSS